jgi:hypothetical protein
MRSKRQLRPVLLAPIVALGLISFTVRFFHHPEPGYPLSVGALLVELVNEVGWVWWPISITGFAAVWFGRSESSGPAIAMYWLVPLWGVSFAALHWSVWGAQKAVAICSPAPREVIAMGSMGETYGIYVFAFAWSAAISLCCAISTMGEGSKGETGLAASLMLAGLSFGAATLHAGAIRLAMTSGSYDVAVLPRAAVDVNTMGAVAG